MCDGASFFFFFLYAFVSDCIELFNALIISVYVDLTRSLVRQWPQHDNQQTGKKDKDKEKKKKATKENKMSM